MPIIDLNKTGRIYEDLKDVLNNEERAHLIKYIMNDLPEKNRILIVTLLKNTGFLTLEGN